MPHQGAAAYDRQMQERAAMDRHLFERASDVRAAYERLAYERALLQRERDRERERSPRRSAYADAYAARDREAMLRSRERDVYAAAASRDRDAGSLVEYEGRDGARPGDVPGAVRERDPYEHLRDRDPGSARDAYDAYIRSREATRGRDEEAFLAGRDAGPRGGEAGRDAYEDYIRRREAALAGRDADFGRGRMSEREELDMLRDRRASDLAAFDDRRSAGPVPGGGREDDLAAYYARYGASRREGAGADRAKPY